MLIRSFRVKVTLALVLSMLLVGILSNFLVYRFTLNSQFNELRSKLSMIAQTAALMIDADILLGIPLNRDGTNSSQHKEILEQLSSVKAANPSIKYIYVLRPTEKEGIWQFVADPDPVLEGGKKSAVTSYPGDRYNAARFPEMLQGLNGPSADKKLEIDEWGVTLSGYAPVRDKTAKAIAVLGIDMAANDVYLAQREVHKRGFWVLVFGVFLSLGIGMSISSGITGPVKKLVEGARRIGTGDLQHRVEISGHDEIHELANSFNQMAKNLAGAQKRIMDYFYDVVQSMVRILEARDSYTRGHSERVARYAVKVAEKLEFPKDKIELLSEMALVHDIGKLSVRDDILNKKGNLTEEEWEIIKKHPIIGEDILKPVILNEEMLAMVRGHHERYDGKGYPDQLPGDKINIFSAILSIADAFDAMTSERAYRPALSREEAIVELREKSGTQFSPDIVNIFLETLL